MVGALALLLTINFSTEFKDGLPALECCRGKFIGGAPASVPIVMPRNHALLRVANKGTGPSRRRQAEAAEAGAPPGFWGRRVNTSKGIPPHTEKTPSLKMVQPNSGEAH